MNTTQDQERQKLLELGRKDPDRLIAKYRQIAHMAPDETLPPHVNFAGIIDAIVTAKVPVYRHQGERWR
jgi:hypothetical protein